MQAGLRLAIFNDYQSAQKLFKIKEYRIIKDLLIVNWRLLTVFLQRVCVNSIMRKLIFFNLCILISGDIGISHINHIAHFLYIYFSISVNKVSRWITEEQAWLYSALSTIKT